MAIKILLYEDNADLRTSLSALINFSNDMELAGVYENCKGILEHIEVHTPDLVLMDIDMPVVNGIEGLKQLRSKYEELPVIMLTVFDDNKHIIGVIKEGATGYLLKQHISSHLHSAVKEAMEGGAPMSPIVARIILQYVNDKRKNKNTYELTLREKDILESLTCGNSYKMIADKFEISIGTVTTHIKNIYGKLGVHSQAEAVAKALKEGLV